MRAARIHDWKTAPVLEDLPYPQRAPGSTLVRLTAATVSHLDLTVQTGEFDLVPPLPYVPGCEGAGVVVESDTLAFDTQVIFRDGAIGLDRDGTWQEFICVPDDTLVALTPTVDPAIAATFFTPTATAAVALFEVGGLEPGQTVMITGATGAVGSMAVQLAHDAGARVLALVSGSARLAGLPAGVSGVALDDEAAVAELARDRPADLLVDTIGGAGLSERIGWVRPGGAVASLGYTAGTEFTIDLPAWFFSSVRILPVNLMAHQPQAKNYAAELLPKFADGTLGLRIEEFSLGQAAEALEKLATHQIAGRAVIRF
ncbi:quinone oxidoreductase family protein [Nocardioides sp.]|uniref:quinone oxidoreductase family protein n=1 Tax=Nocardioides sp. TaxID=35761 RepID=UPI0039E3F03D